MNDNEVLADSTPEQLIISIDISAQHFIIHLSWKRTF